MYTSTWPLLFPLLPRFTGSLGRGPWRSWQREVALLGPSSVTTAPEEAFRFPMVTSNLTVPSPVPGWFGTESLPTSPRTQASGLELYVRREQLGLQPCWDFPLCPEAGFWQPFWPGLRVLRKLTTSRYDRDVGGSIESEGSTCFPAYGGGAGSTLGFHTQPCHTVKGPVPTHSSHLRLVTGWMDVAKEK